MIKIMHQTGLALASFVLGAVLASCETDPVLQTGGILPEREALGKVSWVLRSTTSATEFQTIHLTEGGDSKMDRILCRATLAPEEALKISLTIDSTLLKACNRRYGTDLPLFPEENVSFSAENTMLKSGEITSDTVTVTFSTKGLKSGTYLLPLKAENNEATGVLYYGVVVRGLDKGNYPLNTDYLTVFYLNTGKYQPLLADQIQLIITQNYPPYKQEISTIGNIVNLRVVRLRFDEKSGRALLDMNSDISYVLDHVGKYIRPLQDKGRKVCLCIEGGRTGLGFCNLTDSQIADFTAQVKRTIDTYGLDGVNLFDRNAGYGKEGFPPMNTTSYPKLIVALREALGKDRLLTVADYEEPTEYFWDTEATGGIAVGEYLDYAWSGYVSEDEDIQILDPWGVFDMSAEEAGELGVTLPINNHPRKPIAGLSQENYGCIASPIYANDNPIVASGVGTWNSIMWYLMGYNRNKIIVYYDIMSNEQSAYEGSYGQIVDLFDGLIDGALDEMVRTQIWIAPTVDTFVQYNYLWKDW